MAALVGKVAAVANNSDDAWLSLLLKQLPESSDTPGCQLCSSCWADVSLAVKLSVGSIAYSTTLYVGPASQASQTRIREVTTK